MVINYLYQQEVLGFRPYIINRLKEKSNDPNTLASRLDAIILKINLDFLYGGNEKPIKDMIDDIFD